MAGEVGIPFAYDFEKSYYDNFIGNLENGLQISPGYYDLYYGVTQEEADANGTTRRDGWESYTSDTGVDTGVPIASYVNTVYNGATKMCLVDKLVYKVSNALSKIEIGGCTIQRALYKIVDSFTDVFGSFICTATVDMLGTKCGNNLLDKLKSYRDTEIMTTEEGRKMVKYYVVVGPKIVNAINEGNDPDSMYQYIWAEYISKLEKLVDSDEKGRIIELYLTMMDELIEVYSIDLDKRIRSWVV